MKRKDRRKIRLGSREGEEKQAFMSIDPALLREAVELTIKDAAIPRTAVEEERRRDGFIAEFIAESESLEGNDTTPIAVLNSARDLVLE